MVQPNHPSPFFVADDPALDFLNSVASPWGKNIEWLENGSDLISWLELAHMIPDGVAKRFRREFSDADLDEIAAEARALRDWFRGFVSVNAGEGVSRVAMEDEGIINRILACDRSFYQIGPAKKATSTHSRGFELQTRRHFNRPKDLLLPLAETMANLICQTGFERVKLCNGSGCTLWFNDISKNHTRRWCTMSVCGNRAKASVHRAKKRGAKES